MGKKQKPNIKLKDIEVSSNGDDKPTTIRMKVGLNMGDDEGVWLRDAAKQKDFEGVKQEIENGIDINSMGSYKKTALCVACDHEGSDEIVKFLIERGADPNIGGEGENTPLAYACMYGRLRAVRLLLKAGTDVNRSCRYGRTPLMFAAVEPFWTDDHFEIVKLLLEHGADVHALQDGKDNVLHEMS